jgi:hypothetical protein
MYAVIIAAATAASIAPPTAWKIREATSDGNPKTSSGRNPQKNDPSVKMANPVRKIFLYPIVSEIFPKTRTQPTSTSRYEVATQLTVVVERENASVMAGSAILTIVPSRLDMNIASEIEKISQT